MEEEPRFSSKTSRRDALKKIGVGSALIWSSPALSSLGQAMAQGDGSPVPPTRCTEGGFTCNVVDPTLCGDSNCPLPNCVCDTNTEGGTFCWNNFFCVDSQVCTSSSDCPSGQQCFTNTCCGPQGQCAPDCGVCLGSDSDSNRSGLTGAGQR